MNDTSKDILLSDVQGQSFLSIFNDLSSKLMPHERSLLELMEGPDYNGFDSSLKRDARLEELLQGGDKSYVEILAQAGLEPSYKEGRVKKVMEEARAYLEAN